MTLANSDCGKDVEKAIEDLRGRLSRALRESLPHKVAAVLRDPAAGTGFGYCSESADGERNTKDAEVVVVDLIPQTGVADLIESGEPVETGGVTVRHNHAVENDCETGLTGVLDLARFTEEFCSGGQEEMLAVVGIDIGREKAFDRSCKLSFETVDENRFKNGPFKHNVSFPRRRVGDTTSHGGRGSGFLLLFLVYFRGTLFRRYCRLSGTCG